MDGIINIQPGEIVLLDDRKLEFMNLVTSDGGNAFPDDLQFRDSRTHKVEIFTRAQFDDLYAQGRIQWLPSESPTAEMSPEDMQYDNDLYRARQTFLQKFDEERVSMTDQALETLYTSTLGALHLPFEKKRDKDSQLRRKENFWRTGSTLRRWINGRGDRGARSLIYMRDRRTSGPQAMRIDPAAMEILAEVASDTYWQDRTYTPKDVYVAVRESISTKNQQRALQGLPPIPVPGRSTVWRYLIHHTNYDNTRSRFGTKTANGLYKPNKGSLVVTRILEKAIIDHTVADVHLVDEIHNLPCGRPYITCMVDVASRLPLSFVISFTPPSVETAAACLRRAVKPKKDLETKYPDVRGKMPFGVPKTILCDNGLEFTGTSFKEACLFAGISVEWAPVKTPQYKGVCERLWRTFNQLLIHKLKGSVPYSHDQLRNMGIDPSASAVLLLSEFEELLYQAIIEVYGRSFHEGIKAVPEDVWRKRAEIDGIDYARDLKVLDKALAKRGPVRSLDKNGIEFLGLIYSSDAVFELLNDLIPHRPRQGRKSTSVKVEINYFPEDVSQLFVWNKVRRTWVPLPCTDQKYAKGLSQHHHKAIQDFAKDVGLKFSSEDDRCAARVRLRQKIESFVDKRKIGDRRRAQRLLQSNQVVEVRQEDHSEVLASTIIPIEPVRNRTDGHDPVRSSSRTPKKRSDRAKVRCKRPTKSPLDASPLSPNPDPFAGFDRSKFVKGV